MELIAPSAWRRIDFISDLHLLQQDDATFTAFKKYLASTTCDALFILGDWFEVWIGDDCLKQSNGFESQCAAAVAQASTRLAVYVMHGNRDFLIGADMMATCGATLLDDPTVLDWAGQRWVLSHGDALCLGDHAYLQFREKVRSPQWQSDFLAQSIAQRTGIARELRSQSEARKREVTEYADVDHAAAIALLQRHQGSVLIHGHTHKPAVHEMNLEHTRYVLSDWDATALPPRVEIMRWSWSGNLQDTAHCARLSLANAAAP